MKESLNNYRRLGGWCEWSEARNRSLSV